MSILKSSFTLRPSTSDLMTPEGGGVDQNNRNQPSPSCYLPHGANRLSLDGGIRIYFDTLSQLSFNKKAAFCHPGYHQDGMQFFQPIKQEDENFDEGQSLSHERDDDIMEDCGMAEREDNEGRQASNNNTLSRDDIEDDTYLEDGMRDNVSPEKLRRKRFRNFRNERDSMSSTNNNVFTMARDTSRRSLEHDLDECKKRKTSCN